MGTYLDLIKYDYALYYPVIGAKVRGKLMNKLIFKEYWYGMRVDSYNYPTKPRTEMQNFWGDYYAQAVRQWQSFPYETKSFYNRMKYPPRNTGYCRYLGLYLNASRKYLENYKNSQ